MRFVFSLLRGASPGALAFSAATALAGAVILARLDPRADFLIGTLFGLAIGLGALAFAVRQWRRAAGLS